MNGVYIALIIMAVFMVIMVVLLIIFVLRLRRYTEFYEKTLAGFNNSDNIKDDFMTIFDRINYVEDKCNSTYNACEIVKESTNKCIQKIGFNKYSIDNSGQNKLSFALTLLDNNNDGFLIDSIYTRNGSNIYAKKVKKGEVEENISSEEKKSLEQAINDKKYISRS